MTSFDIRIDDLESPEVRALLREHLDSIAPTAPAESRHALDLAGLVGPDITFWSAWDGPTLAGFGALKHLTESHAEVKSMRTATSHLRRGVASRILRHLVQEAIARGYSRLSLETGSMEFFAAARRLYETCGFKPCAPFGSYRADPNSVFMTKRLDGSAPSIRRAHPGDARKLSELAEATFRTTFGAMNAAEHMELHCRSNYGEEIQAAEISHPLMVTLLSEEDGKLVGYAQLRWGAVPACVSAERPGEIQRLYVIEDWHGKGIAQELMHACIEEVKQRDSDAVWLGVWEHNPRAISFYRKFGFVPAGEHTFPLGGDPQRDIIMVRAVASR